jgi:hypothetical protein
MRWDSFQWDSPSAKWDQPFSPIGNRKGKMIQRLVIVFEKLNLPSFLAKTQTIETALTTEPALTLFADPWPATFPSRTQLTTAFTEFETAFDAENGDKHAIAVRDEKREALTLILKQIAPYLESVAQSTGDTTILETTGYDLRRDITHSTENDIPVAPVLTLKRGTLSGVIIGRVNRLSGVGAYEGQYASGDPNVESNWKNGVLSTKASQIVFENLTPGTMYYFRVRGVGSGGPGAWSDIANLMAV